MSHKLTQAQFIDRACQIHSGKYDYSSTVYISRAAMITVICPNHGSFRQKAGDHLTGRGCKRCTRDDTESFLEKAYSVHGKVYDYSEVIYKSAKINVTIICPHHGLFSQRPSRHITGQGCPRCAQGKQLLSKESFIEKANAVHGSKYEYSQAKYAGYLTKLTIICPNHGSFEQRAGDHLRGQGCVKCSGRLSTEILSFIERAQQVHGGRYDYSQAKYLGNHSSLTIICPVHGPFRKSPGNHLKGQGCIKCVTSTYTARVEGLFFEKASQIHGNKYDYSRVAYTNSKAKVTIICPIHGSFEQRPASHLQGHGCAACANSATSKPAFWKANNWAAIQAGRTAKLYVVRLSNKVELFYKVGITLHSVKKRFRPSSMPYNIEQIAVFSSSSALDVYQVESLIKKGFKGLRYTPNEPFPGQTECYGGVKPILEFLVTQTTVQQIE